MKETTTLQDSVEIFIVKKDGSVTTTKVNGGKKK